MVKCTYFVHLVFCDSSGTRLTCKFEFTTVQRESVTITVQKCIKTLYTELISLHYHSLL